MTQRALQIQIGRIAREQIAKEGWNPDLFSNMLGASGGPKWLVLSQIDRVLFGSFLAKRTTPLHVLGTSIGSFRHSCLGQDDPVAAIGRMETHYIEQRYSDSPDQDEITTVSRGILDQVLGTDGARQIVENKRIITHIGTVRGRGPLALQQTFIHGAGLALAALSNIAHRSLLQPWYQRVIFSGDGTGEGAGMTFRDFSTEYVPLSTDNLTDALMASGSIPLTLRGVPTPAGAPKGLYWDGGIVDYHHDLRAYTGKGLLLYPHFYPTITPGWFDKSLKGRWPTADLLERVVLISPSKRFVDTLPQQKIPDRKDFTKLPQEQRIKQWWDVTEQCRVLADELQELLQQNDPLQHTEPFP